jgi:ABC-type uncharacterized transport system permease subunit
MKKIDIRKIGIIGTVAAFLLITGCATHISKPAKEIMPTKVRFGEFENVEMKSIGISEKFASAAANQKALKKIDEILFRDIKMVFPSMKRVETGEDFSSTGGRILQITPFVKEIKFIGGAARFWVGAMAGSSAVLMQVTYRDSSTGEIIADPEFLRTAGAHAGAWSMGRADNKMLEDIAEDVVRYSSSNR